MESGSILHYAERWPTKIKKIIMEITQENNFCRVFELPNSYPEKFCNQGGHIVEFKMIDWFNPIPQQDIINDNLREWVDYKDMLAGFVRRKGYCKHGRKYLILTDFGKSIIIGE